MKYALLVLVGVIALLSCKPACRADVPSHPRLLSELPELLGSEEGIEELHKEYEAVEAGKRRPWTVAEKPQNIKKNRYEDLLAFDHSRVVLEPLADDPDSDYINANYMDGINSEHEYIATQGPLPNTINDFWRMIVQQNSTRIIMLANIIEHGETKVEKYWPDTSDTNETYGEYEITALSEDFIPNLNHVVRTFAIKKPDMEKPHIVRQFHFIGWPDKGVPTDRLPVIAIANQARLFDRENKAPIVVHCSAGVGRTGTLILMDSIIMKARHELSTGDNVKVDFQKRLERMRTLRPDMVEKKEQYVFAYEAVNDVFNVPDTLGKLQEIEKMYQTLDD